MPFDWTAPGAIDMLTALWADGQPSSAISRQLTIKYGGSLTRSAVIGKASRLHLSRRNGTRHDTRPKARVTKFNFSTNATKAAPKPAERDTYVHRETIVTPEHERVAFEVLEQFDKRCRYPHGDNPPYAYCGAKAVLGQPWCLTHFRVCAPAMAAKHEAAQVFENLKELEAVS